MELEFAILVAERNRHVRILLQRELESEGYEVAAAGNDREINDLLGSAKRYDLLVMDDDIPDVGGGAVVRELRKQGVRIPVIVHAHSVEDAGEALSDARAMFVRKCEDTTMLKSSVRTVLRRFYPERFSDSRSEGNGS